MKEYMEELMTALLNDSKKADEDALIKNIVGGNDQALQDQLMKDLRPESPNHFHNQG